ncbi:unnamed protein product [Clonostachys chloroleuca]|uniref:Carboxylic ester hydrolase n=1 Tax=Clonostachys chloroleuca TaxID=1926264 RepID=A0AA35PYR5_9HYPO|nr:unnamed protein product [Clonostachys chloroleuca]
MSLISNSSACAAGAFPALTPVYGTEILAVHASVVSNFTMEADSSLRYTSPSVVAQGLSFCNVTVVYTHSDTDDEVYVEAWLPPSESWNERLFTAGGSGFGAGRFLVPYTGMAGALTEGFATVTSDAGLGSTLDDVTGAPWILKSPGNVNLQLVQNFGSTSLKEEAVLAKQLIEAFYGKKPEYSYFNGCSQGGRQGMALAQHYPEEYDGILVGAPGINLPKVVGSIFWPQQVMNEIGEHPHDCEIDAIVHASISVCDKLDGVEDGVIAEYKKCLDTFDPFGEVGRNFTCWPPGEARLISASAAAVVNATWRGMPLSGRQSWPGLNPGTNLTGTTGFQNGICRTNCTGDGACSGLYNALGNNWMKYFGAKNPDYSIDNLTRAEFQGFVRLTAQELASYFQTDDADLSPLQQAGGKLISWHGTADDGVPPEGTAEYFRRVKDLIPEVGDFYQHYEIAGLAHCAGGSGGQPVEMFQQLRAWVENGTVPENSPVTYTGPDSSVWKRIICPYPQKATVKAGCEDLKSASCWQCA